MDHLEAGKYWEANAEGWTVMSRLGYDRSRDLFNTPTFLRMLPDVAGLAGLDIGCGEGANTRVIARLGATMTGIDIAPTFIRHAQVEEDREPCGIRYLHASGVNLPFQDASFDFATAFMSFQDIPDQENVVAEAYRVIKPGGFLQFSMTHPCFQTPKWGWIEENGRRVALTVGDYFDQPQCRIDEWIFGAAPADLKQRFDKFKTPYFMRTLSSWLNMLLAAGFQLEEFAEPTPDDETLQKYPREYDARLIAYFLIIRCRKPQGRSEDGE